MICGCGNNDGIDKYSEILSGLLAKSYDLRALPEGGHKIEHPEELSDDIFNAAARLHESHVRALWNHRSEKKSPQREAAIENHSNAIKNLSYELNHNYGDETGINIMFTVPTSNKQQKQGKLSMRTYNSKTNDSRKFNSKRLGGKPDKHEGLTMLYARGDSRFSQFKEDPEYTHVRIAARNMAQHVLNNYKKFGLKEPNEEQQYLFGIEKKRNGTWGYNPAKSKLSNRTTLSDYLNVPFQSKTPGYSKGTDRVANFFYDTQRPIGRDEQGHDKLPGVFTDYRGVDRFSTPMVTIGAKKAMRDTGYSRLLERRENDIEPYFKVAKTTAHMFHPSLIKPGDPEYNESLPGQYRSMARGARPVFSHDEVEAVLKNIANENAINSPLNEKMKTAKMTSCDCPSCALDQFVYPTHSWYDIQHDDAAFHSTSHPLTREAFITHLPTGYVGDQRVTDLGIRGVKTPHRTFWGTDHAKAFIKHAIALAKDEGNKLYSGIDTFLHKNLPSYSMDYLREKTNKNLQPANELTDIREL